MARKNQHVVPFGNGWAVKAEGSEKLTIITTRKADAITVAKDLAKNNHSSLIVHKKDGRIQTKNNYAHYPGGW